MGCEFTLETSPVKSVLLEVIIIAFRSQEAILYKIKDSKSLEGSPANICCIWALLLLQKVNG